ncbi:MAG: 4-hydroxy-3-methylbut-2-enyl diphosphate reductase [Lachnospiraceae bacterium]|nr:4-hydroxy-3-methylbut-2-enyl diphosphate reductase [Lachnospiraceae bacterium]
MKVTTAKSAGFCFGVRQAVDTVYGRIGKNEDIYTYGPIIHNDTVVKELESKGVKVIRSREELEKLKGVTVVIRSHGVPKDIYELIHKNGCTLVDATCPFVLKIHQIVEDEAKKGSQIVIAGDPDHPEVQGILSFAGKDVAVIKDAEEAETLALDPGRKVFLVAQTTFHQNKFKELVEILEKKRYIINVVNTICNATSARQSEAEELSRHSDAMIVIGDTMSSNSRKLYEICSEHCGNTIFIQTLEDLVSRNGFFSESTACVGITAGASTPSTIIEEVQNYVRRYDFWTNARKA